MSLRVIFAGTPEFAAAHLQYLVDQNINVVAVYSQPDRPAGRGRKLSPSSVKEVALKHNIAVEQPVNFKDPLDVEKLAAYEADVMVVVAYGLLLPESVLNTPASGCINVHGSLLPRWRGAAPIHRCLLAGDEQTGVTIMQMDRGLDTGDMLVKSTCSITPDDTSQTLHDKLIELGKPALLATLNQIETKSLKPIKQDNALANYAHKLTKEEGDIDWSQDAQVIVRQILGLNPWPVAYTQLGGKNIRIREAVVVDEQSQFEPGEIISNKKRIVVQTGKGQVQINNLQLPGSKAMAVDVLLNGKADLFAPKTKLGL